MKKATESESSKDSRLVDFLNERIGKRNPHSAPLSRIRAASGLAPFTPPSLMAFSIIR